MCLYEHSTDITLVTASRGIEFPNPDPYSGELSLNKNTDRDTGTAVVSFADDVMLWLNASQIRSGITLPLDRLGTEYYIVLPQMKEETTYIAHICTTRNKTVVFTEIKNAQPLTPAVSHLDIHEIITIKRSADFSGSRVLSTHAVGIFCSFGKAVPYQILPSHMFGKKYGVINCMQLFYNETFKFTLRLISIFNNTKVNISSGQTTILETRGGVTDLEFSSNNVLAVVSEKALFVLLMYDEGLYMPSMYYVPPVEQYVGGARSYIDNCEKLQIYYSIPSSQTFGMQINVFDYVTGKDNGRVHKAHRIIQRDTDFSFGEQDVNVTEAPSYFSVSNKSPIGIIAMEQTSALRVGYDEFSGTQILFEVSYFFAL